MPEERRHEERPVLFGLVALVAVAVVVGLVLGGGALLATRVLGLDGGTATSGESAGGETLWIPDPTRDPTTSGTPKAKPERRPSESPTEEQTKITLQAGQDAVGVMERIDLTGVYPTGEGAILQVQQFKDGAWTDFPVIAPVSGGTFTTWIQASMIGLNRFRMLDTDTGEISNEVRVRIG